MFRRDSGSRPCSVGVLGFAVSFLLYNWAIALVDARTSAVILNLIPSSGSCAPSPGWASASAPTGWSAPA